MATDTQQLVIIGDSIECDKATCSRDAIVLLRQRDKDGVSGIAYCEEHWLETRAAYVPLDTKAAVREAERVTARKSPRRKRTAGGPQSESHP